MWHRERKWANDVGKMAHIDLLHAGLPQVFHLYKKKNKKQKTSTSAKRNKMKYACIQFFKFFYFSLIIFFLLLWDQKVNLLCFPWNKKAQLASRLFWVARARSRAAAHPGPPGTSILLLLLYRQKLSTSPRNQPLHAGAEGTQSGTGEEGGSTSQRSLPHKPRRVHRARKARGPHPEWVCWVAGSDRIKVTQVHGDPAGWDDLLAS